MTSHKKLLVIGHKRHGKDSVCEHLRDAYGLIFSSSSWFACERFIFEQMRHEHGYQTAQECFDDRDNHRAFWYNAIVQYNTPDLARMGREIFSENDVYCGLRNIDEFMVMREQGLFDLAIWVDASQRKEPEPSSSMNLTMDMADIVLDNNGTLDELIVQVDIFAQSVLRLKPLETQENVRQTA